MLHTDARVLRTEAYGNADKLRARMAIYQYQQPRHDLRTHVIGFLREVNGPVLDVGCGPGHFARALRAEGHDVLAADLSYSMAASTGVPASVADASALPFRDDAFGAATALHMLYHVPEPARALQEIKRVLRPGGTLVIATIAADDKAELRAAHKLAADRAGTPIPDLGWFLLDKTEVLARGAFDTVERHDVRSTVEVPFVEPVVAYIDSTRAWYGDGPEVLPHLQDVVAEVIARNGAFTFATHTGFLVCR
jgi:SAM-dependent methyltransferase